MRSVLKDNYLLVGILVLGACLRLYHIDFQSIWMDEIHTMNEANPALSFGDTYNTIKAGEQMPPLYFYLVQLIFRIFGYTAIAARMFSVILGIAGIYAIYVFGKKIGNKISGLLAALLLSINSFHIYYSQEARPYAFFFLFTILSFYSLVQFIEQRSLRRALIYGAMAALMIYGHFFGLFVLVSQYVILLIFFIVTEKKARIQFLINSFVSGITTLLLLLPALPIFLNILKIEQFWLPPPAPDAFTLIFKEFFGNADITLHIISIVFIAYMISLIKVENTVLHSAGILENKKVFSFIILFIWVIISVLLPVIKSYISIPFIHSRYFISALPAVVLIATFGILTFRNNIIKLVVVSALVLFSLTDLFLVKKYYTQRLKTQYREATDFVKANNKANHVVATDVYWYLPYFFNEGAKTQIIDKPLDALVAEMKSDASKIKPFWYISNRAEAEAIPADIQQYLDMHFYPENNFTGVGIWTKHFILIDDAPKTIDLSQFGNIGHFNGNESYYHIEEYKFENNILEASGWGYFPEGNAIGTNIQLVLLKDDENRALPTQHIQRPDVTSYFKSDYNIDNSGFRSHADLSSIEPGSYKLALYMVNKTLKKESLHITDKIIQKN